jgi:cobalt/nickel transport system ATP-binding protein
MGTVFTVDEASYAYPGCGPSLDRVSLTIGQGERVALLGANGSGKSTLLCLLDGLYFPTSGTITALGETLTEEALERTSFGPRFRRAVGFLFQNSDAQLFCPTVEAELSFGPLQLRLPTDEIRQRITDTLALLGLEQLRDRCPQNLSGGEKKRVALASLLAVSPSVLLLDEPTAGLDPRSQSVLLEILEGLSEAGITLVTATHDLALAPHLADRAIVLGEDHRIAADAPVDVVLRGTELLLAVNLIHAHRHAHGGEVHEHAHRHVMAHDHRHHEAAG